MASFDAIVVGGGVIGTAVAFGLAREELSVLLVERDGLGQHASGVAAGMLAPVTETLHAEPEAMLEPGLLSLELFVPFMREAADLSGIDPDYQQTGTLHASTELDAQLLRRRAEALSDYGSCWLSPEEALKREPHLHPEIAGAVWTAREARVDGTSLVRAFSAAAARLRARLSVRTEVMGFVREGARVIGIRTLTGEHHAAETVLCSGAWAGLATEWLGTRVPIEPLRGQILSLDAPGPQLASIVWGGGVYLVPRRDGTLLVGATQERVGFQVSTTAGGIASLLRGALEVMPELGASAFLGARAGLRALSPDRLPLIGRLPGLGGLSLAVGHHRHGLLLAPLSALAIADLLVREELDPRLAAFEPGRFAPPSS